MEALVRGDVDVRVRRSDLTLLCEWQGVPSREVKCCQVVGEVEWFRGSESLMFEISEVSQRHGLSFFSILHTFCHNDHGSLQIHGTC